MPPTRPTRPRCLRSRGLEAERLLERGLRLGADRLRGDLSVAVEHHVRDAAHTGALRQYGLVVDVDLADLDGPGALGRDLLDHGAEHAAGSAPRRPVVHDHGHVGGEDLLVEVGLGEGDDVAHVCCLSGVCSGLAQRGGADRAAVLLEVALVIILGVVEVGGRRDLGDDLLAQVRLALIARGDRLALLLGVWKKIAERYWLPKSQPCRLRVVGSWTSQNVFSRSP